MDLCSCSSRHSSTSLANVIPSIYPVPSSSWFSAYERSSESFILFKLASIDAIYAFCIRLWAFSLRLLSPDVEGRPYAPFFGSVEIIDSIFSIDTPDFREKPVRLLCIEIIDLVSSLIPWNSFNLSLDNFAPFLPLEITDASVSKLSPVT